MNNVVIIGRLTKDVELRYTADERQMAIARFTVAVNRYGKQDETDFIRVVVFGKSAENCDRFLRKGSQCAIQGHIQTGSYKDKDGRTVYTTEVVGDRVKFFFENKREEADETQIQAEVPPEFSTIDEDLPF